MVEFNTVLIVGAFFAGIYTGIGVCIGVLTILDGSLEERLFKAWQIPIIAVVWPAFLVAGQVKR